MHASVQYYYIFPALSAVGYALTVIVLKRAMQHGAGAMSFALVGNVVSALFGLPLLLFVDEPPRWELVGWPLWTGLVAFVGLVLTFLAVRLGDVSVQVPIQGSKAVFVAAFSVLLGAGTVPLEWWLGAGLTTAGVLLLGIDDLRRRSLRHAAWPIAVALLSCVTLAYCDVLLQKHGQRFGPIPFIVLLGWVIAGLSVIVCPMMGATFGRIPRPARPWVWWAAALLSLQGLGIGLTLSVFGDATAVNIIYASRGLWSILLVWTVGHWFGNHERHAGPATMILRLFGAALLMAAIVLVVLAPTPS